MSRVFLLTLMAFYLFGCAATGTPVPVRTAEQLVPEYTYQINKPLEAPVGEPMTASSPLMLAEVLVFDSAIEATTSHRGEQFRVRAPSGTYMMAAQDAAGHYYVSSSKQLHVNDESYPGGIFIPAGKDNEAGLFWRWNHSITSQLPLNVYVAYLPADPVPSSESAVAVVPPGYYDGLVSTLSYVGMSGGEIRFVYREYEDRMARAAFTQEVAFNYEPESEYAYKSARFIVHEAGSLGVKYTILNPL